MSKLFNVSNIKAARTENGAVTHASSGEATLDMFSQMGAMRNNQSGFMELFNRAVKQNPELAVRALQYLRDVRGGIGERKLFRNAVTELIKHHKDYALRLLPKIPVIGRWDDVLVYFGTNLEKDALGLIFAGLADESTRALVAKWMPHNSRNENFKVIRRALGVSPKELRKLFSSYAKVVETDITEGNFDNIDYEKLPSRAAARYQKLFLNKGGEKYQKYVQSLQKGTAKVNATTLTPADVLVATRHGVASVAQAQWEALPDYMNGNSENILCMTDVSGSMTCENFGAVNALDIGVALSIYCAERDNGIFKDKLMAYSTNPFFIDISGGNTLKEKENIVRKHVEYGSTNLQKAFNEIVNLAVKHNLSQEDLPSKVIVFSDMEFDSVFGYKTNFEAMNQVFTEHGYTAPQVIYWKLAARSTNNYTNRMTDKRVAMVGGFSAATLKSVLGGEDLTPLGVMLKAILDSRYDF